MWVHFLFILCVLCAIAEILSVFLPLFSQQLSLLQHVFQMVDGVIHVYANDCKSSHCHSVLLFLLNIFSFGSIDSYSLFHFCLSNGKSFPCGWCYNIFYGFALYPSSNCSRKYQNCMPSSIGSSGASNFLLVVRVCATLLLKLMLYSNQIEFLKTFLKT